MTSKAQARRHKKARTQATAPTRATQGEVVPITRKDSTKPTAQRLARGSWISPDKREGGPYVDAASDMIGRLYVERQLNASQEQAARQFLELREGYLSELGVSGYKSCLAGSSSSFDAGDGNEAVIKAYRSLEERIGRVKTALLQIETDKLADQRPNDLEALKNALNCVLG